MRDTYLASRVLAATGSLELNSQALRHAASTDALHEIVATEYVVEGLSDGEMRLLYDQQLSRQGRPGRLIYDAVMASAKHGLCTYCQYGQATTLDHFVPKSLVAGLAIDPWNLIPACQQCNKELLDKWATTPNEQALYPYMFPAIGRWLGAAVSTTVPLVVEFFAYPDTDLNPDLRARIENQFDRLKLGRLYSVVSASDVVETSAVLARNFEVGDSVNVRAHLSELAAGALSADPNGRRGALFEALAADEWYCHEGFDLQGVY